MSPDEITQVYNTLAQEVQDYGAQQAAAIGNAQRSLGPLAARVASPSGQTNGLANYTYNRVMRPTIEPTVASLVVEGQGQSLNKTLNDALRAAKKAYEDAKNANQLANTKAATTPTTTNGGNGNVQVLGGYTGLTSTGNYGSGGDNNGDNNGGDNTAKTNQWGYAPTQWGNETYYGTDLDKNANHIADWIDRIFGGNV